MKTETGGVFHNSHAGMLTAALVPGSGGTGQGAVLAEG